MRLLATNMLIWQDVKPRFKWGVSILPIGLMFAAFVPIVAIAIWLAGALRLATGPVRGQSNGLLWLILFLSMMLAGYALGWVLNAAIARTIFEWPAEKVRDVFLESKIPQEWREPDAADAGGDGKSAPARNRASWAMTRRKGRWYFVLARGVFGWGGAMFVGMGLMPVLMHRHEASWSYFVSQALVWSLAGAFFGFATWSWCEWQFTRQSTVDGPRQCARRGTLERRCRRE
jgi:hypothetical protein